MEIKDEGGWERLGKGWKRKEWGREKKEVDGRGN